MRRHIFTLLLLALPYGVQAQISAETRYQIPETVRFDPAPAGRNSLVNSTVLTYSIDADNNTVPLKTLRITNNADFTVYPVMRDGNEAVIIMQGDSVGLYDPYDPVNTEYRGYVGYKGMDGKYYFGLPKGQTVTIRIPLVFWNGARMSILTDGSYLTPKPGTPNPLQYDLNARCVMAAAERDDSTIANGIVMWYRSALHVGPALDAPDQLVEWTVRDRDYLSKIRTRREIAASEKVNLINYDVSYVDNMFLPVAIAALDVPIPAPPYPPGQNPAPYGWIGSTKTIDSVTSKINDFTTGNKLLGTYFGKKGWPRYNIPRSPGGAIKIPAGQNIFAQSPLAGALSSHDLANNHFMLSSGDTLPIRQSIGGEGNDSTGRVLTLSRLADVKFVNMLMPGFSVVGNPPAGKKNPVLPGAKIRKILHVSTGPGDPSQIELDTPLVASQAGCVFDFSRPVADYASEALIKLWYSWAQYYLNYTQHVGSIKVAGAVEQNKATLRFKAPVNGLIEGMQVSGPGIVSDRGEGKGGVIILSIAEDKKSVTLSQLATGNYPLSTDSAYYTYQKPQPLPGKPADLYALRFSTEKYEPSRDSVEFSKKVYLVMASMAQIPPKTNLPHVLELMYNVIGGNMGFIFDANDQRFSEDGLAISADIRDMIKSILRGVTDFTKFPESQGHWYPDPAVPQGGLTFNAFNLDPFVWFVHVQLKFSGYGFSLDDDVADVGAGEATRLQLTVGGDNGLRNRHEWTIQAPYGPVTDTVFWDPSKKASNFLGISGATNAAPIVITSDKHGLANGDTVIIDQVIGNDAANGTFRIANVTENTFELVNSIGNSPYKSSGRWTAGPLPYIMVNPSNVYWKVKADDLRAGFQGALVDGPGVPKKGTIRVMQLGDSKQGILMLNKPLTNTKGTYKLTFSGN